MLQIDIEQHQIHGGFAVKDHLFRLLQRRRRADAVKARHLPDVNAIQLGDHSVIIDH